MTEQEDQKKKMTLDEGIERVEEMEKHLRRLMEIDRKRKLTWLAVGAAAGSIVSSGFIWIVSAIRSDDDEDEVEYWTDLEEVDEEKE